MDKRCSKWVCHCYGPKRTLELLIGTTPDPRSFHIKGNNLEIKVSPGQLEWYSLYSNTLVSSYVPRKCCPVGYDIPAYILDLSQLISRNLIFKMLAEGDSMCNLGTDINIATEKVSALESTEEDRCSARTPTDPFSIAQVDSIPCQKHAQKYLEYHDGG